MSRLMILGASILQLPAITKAKELGLEVVVVDQDKDAVGFQYADISEIISTIDTDSVLDAAKKHKIDGIITLATDRPIITVAKVSHFLNLRSISVETALNTCNKNNMRNILFNNHVPVPEYYSISNYSDFEAKVNELLQRNMKLIIKPSDSSGSRGVFLLETLDNIESLIDIYNFALKHTTSGIVLIEEYMEGPEVSVETFSVDGNCHVIQITDKLTTGSPHFVEMGHSQPSRLDAKTLEEIKSIAKKACQALNIDKGPSHTEIIVTQEGPKIVEVGARLGGDNITTHLVPLSTGINLVECCIKDALGEKVDLTPKIKKGSAIRYFHSKEGLISAINGINKAKAVQGVNEVVVTIEKGTQVGEITCSGDRMGYVIASGEKNTDAINSCDLALSMINVEIV